MRNKSVSSSSASPNYTCGMPFPMRIQPLDSEAYREASIRNEVATATAKPVLKSRLKKLLDGILKNPGAKKLVAGDSSDDELDESITAPSCDDSLDILKILIPCANIAERHLLADTSKIIDKNKTCKRKDDLRKIVTDGLLLLGYDASICISRWEKSPSFPAGEYEYIDVIVDGGDRLLIDIDFRSEFEIARPTGGYKSILQSLPHIFVGGSDRLHHIVSIVSEAARQSLKRKGMHIPPWRKAEYMRSKWLSPHSRKTVAAAVAPPKAAVQKEESLSGGDLELIFSEETSSWEEIAAVSSESLSPVENSGEEKKYIWQPPAIERKSCERGTKVITGLASLLGERE